MLFDLHTHTHFSDGCLSPAELLSAAEQCGITHLAITDHDNALAACSLEKSKLPESINLIPGMEFSTRWQSTDIHVLALNFEREHEALKHLINKQSAARRERNARILHKLFKAGVEVSFEATLEKVPQVGRVHIADLLVENGYARNRQQAFKKFLGRSGKAYVKSNWVSLQDIIEATHAAGGKTVLAHPLKYRLTRAKTRTIVADYAAVGGDALEVISGKQAPSDTSAMADLAQENQLAASLGSDFHSPAQAWCKLGCAGYLPERCRPVWADWFA